MGMMVWQGRDGDGGVASLLGVWQANGGRGKASPQGRRQIFYSEGFGFECAL